MPLKEGTAPRCSAPSLSTLCLLISCQLTTTHCQLTLRLCSHFMQSTHWLFQIACDSQHLHQILWESWLVLAQKPNNVLRRKGHWLNHLRSTRVDCGLLRVLLLQKQLLCCFRPSRDRKTLQSRGQPLTVIVSCCQTLPFAYFFPVCQLAHIECFWLFLCLWHFFLGVNWYCILSLPPQPRIDNKSLGIYIWLL